MDSDVWQSARILLRRFVYGVHEGNHLAGNLSLCTAHRRFVHTTGKVLGCEMKILVSLPGNVFVKVVCGK